MARVLVVDDDRALARVVGLSLQLEGLEVDCCTSPFDALASVANGGRPDVLVLDLNMPGMDGWTFYREARRAGYENPVLILSAYTAEQACRELGADDWLAKPFLPDELVRKVQRLSGGHVGGIG